MKDKIFIISFFIIIYTFLFTSLIIPKKTISETEKRYLKELPKFNFDSTYATELEDYLLDHFPLRDKFRSLKAYFNYQIIRKEENNDIHIYKNGIYKSNYPTNYKAIDNYYDYIKETKSYLKATNHTSLTLIPDKNYYLPKKNFLQIDYNYIYSKARNLDINLIDVRNILTLNDYYLTDTHLKQEKLDNLLKKILSNFNINYQKIPYTYHEYQNFKGIYYSEAAINNEKDTLIYITNPYIDNVKVNYLENSNLKSLYNLEKLDSFDSYEVYLDGASSFIEIDNQNSLTNKELIIFRDSFGSSLTPLLVPYYKKITVIDNRYIPSKIYLNLVEFKDQDVLFLNSTLLVNQSFTLKK